jgi:hypothetical protein
MGAAPPLARLETPRVRRWTMCAGIGLVVLGAIDLIHGYQALERQGFFTEHVIYDNLTFWGWVFICWGLVQLVAGVGAIANRTWAIYTGVVVASFAIVLWFCMIFAAPFAALIGIGLNGLVVIGLNGGIPYDWDP